MHSGLRCIALALLSAWSQFGFADETADREAIEAASQAWVEAYNTRDIDGLIRIVADDVVLLDPTLAPVSGRRAAHEALQRALSRNTAALATTSKEIEIAGDVAWRIATLSYQRTNSIGKPTQILEIWQRADGEWKLRRQMSSGLLASPAIMRAPPEGPMLDSRSH